MLAGPCCDAGEKHSKQQQTVVLVVSVSASVLFLLLKPPMAAINLLLPLAEGMASAHLVPVRGSSG